MRVYLLFVSFVCCANDTCYVILFNPSSQKQTICFRSIGAQQPYILVLYKFSFNVLFYFSIKCAKKRKSCTQIYNWIFTTVIYKYQSLPLSFKIRRRRSFPKVALIALKPGMTDRTHLEDQEYVYFCYCTIYTTALLRSQYGYDIIVLRLPVTSVLSWWQLVSFAVAGSQIDQLQPPCYIALKCNIIILQ